MHVTKALCMHQAKKRDDLLNNTVAHEYENFHLLLLLYGATRWQGEPTPLEGQTLGWYGLQNMYTLAMPPADAPLIHWLEKYWVR